jgi:hypothetical protein
MNVLVYGGMDRDMHACFEISERSDPELQQDRG